MHNISYSEANRWCQNEFDSTLATIYTPKQYETVRELCLSSGTSGEVACWIGLRYSLIDEYWHWEDTGYISMILYWGDSEGEAMDGQECAGIAVTGFVIDTNYLFPGDMVDIVCNFTYPKLTICNDPPEIVNAPSLESKLINIQTFVYK